MVKRSEQEVLRPPVDWYAVLGVSPEASAEAIRLAWRGLARAWHPDRAGESAQARDRFEAIQSAHAVLGDPAARAQHDGERRLYADRVAPLPGGVVERFVGVRRPEALAGRNRLYRLTVSSADAITGRRCEIDLPEALACPTCAGTGLAPLGRPVLCERCGGRCFEVHRPVLRALGEPCTRCEAAGWVPDRPCTDCGGKGSVPGFHTVKVDVPAGITDGAQIRLRGHGEAALGTGERGDLLVALEVSDGRYRVRGDDWEATEAIPFWRALAGGPWTVATPWGPRVIKLPIGTRDGDLLHLAGLGVAQRGDGYLKVSYIWPASLSVDASDRLVRWGESLEAPRDPDREEKPS